MFEPPCVFCAYEGMFQRTAIELSDDESARFAREFIARRGGADGMVDGLCVDHLRRVGDIERERARRVDRAVRILGAVHGLCRSLFRSIFPADWDEAERSGRGR